MGFFDSLAKLGKELSNNEAVREFKEELEKFLNKNIENYVIFTSKEIAQNKFYEKLNNFVNNLNK